MMNMHAKLKLAAGTLLCAMVLAGCGGGLNASNPDAPSSVNAHECTWVTTHPKKIVEMITFRVISSATQATFNATYGEDELIQCRVCHGSSFLGAGGGAAGPACLDCHIADPVRYPAGCYSCHGGVIADPRFPDQVSSGPYEKFYARYSTTPQFSQYSAARQAFIDRVKSGSIHNRLSLTLPRNHNALAYVFADANPQDTCVYCHNQEANANIHHSEAIASRFSCGFCHFRFVAGELQFVIIRDCKVCHVQPI